MQPHPTPTPFQMIVTIGAAGFIGANVRYWLGVWIAESLGRMYPFGTFIINVSGSVLLGVFLTWAAKRVDIDPLIQAFVAVGFFGAYTTFSSFANESVALMQRGDWLAVLAYVGLTNVLCIGGAAFGVWLGGQL